MNTSLPLQPYKGAVIGILILTAVGCTTTDPHTGQSRVDYGATAGAAGLALGAAALGVALSNDDDDEKRDVTIINRRPGYRPAYRPYKRGKPARPYYRR